MLMVSNCFKLESTPILGVAVFGTKAPVCFMASAL
jgi:hypothetical protein